MIDLSFLPDWHVESTAEEFTEEFPTFIFKNVGWYLASDGSALLVISIGRKKEGKEIYSFCVYSDLVAMANMQVISKLALHR
jgi:hypothetical protein